MPASNRRAGLETFLDSEGARALKDLRDPFVHE